MKHTLWLSFDLGLRGDYEGLFRWLDEHDARECGDNVACFTYETEGDLQTALKTDLQRSVDITPKSRIYLIRTEAGKPKGRFLFGSRKKSPWVGYGATVDEGADDES